MKSYKDKRLLFGLLFLGVAAGYAGHFFETEHISFPSASNLSQAAAILATEQNIVGNQGAPSTPPEISLGFADTAKDATALSATEDIVFSPLSDCGTGGLTIREKESYTVGFLCISANDPDFDKEVVIAAAEVNALIVSPDFSAKTSAADQLSIADKTIDDGAVMVVGSGLKASISPSFYDSAPIIYSLGSKGKDAPQISVTAELKGRTVTNTVIK